MSRAGNQQQIVLGLLATLQPHWRKDRNLPSRIQTLLSANRSFGSRDRRLYRELIYTVLRYLPWIEPQLFSASSRAIEIATWLAGESPVTAELRAALLVGWPRCPDAVSEKAELLEKQLGLPDLPPVLPGWFSSHCPEAFEPEQTDALLSRPPLWLRLQTRDAGIVLSEFDSLGWKWRRPPVLDSAVQLEPGLDLAVTDSHRNGLVEVQDLGSQMILASTKPEPGGRWLDACAGAGGKTLQLAGLLGISGSVHAHDNRPSALDELVVRVRRAGLTNIQVVRQPDSAYDAVLVDAPCSGSGTWRRSPHLKWITSAADIDAAARQQLELLERFSRLVRPGGRLIYATCSLSSVENESVVGKFLGAHGEFSAETPANTFGFPVRGAGITILPARYDTDGFFVAALRRQNP